MALLEKQLIIKRSKIPGAGKGLFTKKLIEKATRITEYKGRITTWKEVQHGNVFNAYVYYVKRGHVIDAMKHKKVLARYINDAAGITRIKGITNNCNFVNENGRVFIESTKKIEAGEELYVAYGKEYWDVIRYNNKLAKKANKKSVAKKL